MQDITFVFGMPCARDSRVIAQHEAGGVAPDRTGDDELRAHLLITSWTPTAGSTLRTGVPPQLLSEDELTSFWADEQVTAYRRAATRPGSPQDAL